MRRFERDEAPGLQAMFHVPVSDLAQAYGRPNGRRLYDRDDLIVRFRVVLIDPTYYDREAYVDVRQERPASDPPGTDPVECPTLREAVVFANTNATLDGAPTIDTIVLPAGTYTLSTLGLDETFLPAEGENPPTLTNTPDAAIGDLDISEPLPFVVDDILLRFDDARSTAREPGAGLEQGAEVGYVIITLGIVGVLLAVWRLIALTITGGKVSAQLKRPESGIARSFEDAVEMACAHPIRDGEGVA